MKLTIAFAIAILTAVISFLMLKFVFIQCTAQQVEGSPITPCSIDMQAATVVPVVVFFFIFIIHILIDYIETKAKK